MVSSGRPGAPASVRNTLNNFWGADARQVSLDPPKIFLCFLLRETLFPELHHGPEIGLLLVRG